MNQLHFFLPEFKLKSLLMNMFKSILLLINLALFTLPFTKNHPTLCANCMLLNSCELLVEFANAFSFKEIIH